MPHVEDGQLHALLDGALAEAETRALHEHTNTCAECAARLAEARALRARAAAILTVARPAASELPPFEAVLERAQRPGSPSRSARVVSLSSLARAAMIILALGTGWFSRDLVQRAALREETAGTALDGTAPVSAPPASSRAAEQRADQAPAPPAPPENRAANKEGQVPGTSPAPVPVAEPPARGIQAEVAAGVASSAESANALRKSTAVANVSGQSQMQAQTQAQMQVQQSQSPTQRRMAATPPAPLAARVVAVDVAQATLQWQFMSLERAEQLIGRRVLRVPGLEVINVGIADEGGSQLVLTRQRLADQGTLELLHRRTVRPGEVATSDLAGARAERAASEQERARSESDDVGGSVMTVQRNDGTLTARAFLAPDSLRALLARVQ